jgi:hypothetical protein
MIKDTDGLPKVGQGKRCLLGVRPIGQHADIDLIPPGDVNGDVSCNEKGLSVVDDWRKLPGHLVPDYLDDGHNGASGKNMFVFVHGNGTGPFSAGAFAHGLEVVLKQGRVDSGVICPVAQTSLHQYQADLAATRQHWDHDDS